MVSQGYRDICSAHGSTRMLFQLFMALQKKYYGMEYIVMVSQEYIPFDCTAMACAIGNLRLLLYSSLLAYHRLLLYSRLLA